MESSDGRVSVDYKVLKYLQNQIYKLECEREKIAKENEDLNLKLHQLMAEDDRGLPALRGKTFPLSSFSITNTEDGKSIATVTFTILGGSFTIILTLNEKQDILNTNLDITNVQKLLEIEKHLVNLQLNNDPQQIIFDILTFKDLNDMRDRVVHSLKESNVEGLQVSSTESYLDEGENSVKVKAFNTKSSEIYFELKWDVCFEDRYSSLCHHFIFKCIPLVKPENSKINSLISNLQENYYWFENHSELRMLWDEILKWITENASC